MASRNSGSESGYLVLLLLVGGFVLAYNLILGWWTARPFEPILSQSRHVCNTTVSHTSTTAAHRTGPVLLVHANGGQVHGEFRGLDASVRAKDAAAVVTVACLKESEIQVGRYTDGAAAYAIVWAVRLVDFKEGQLIGTARFVGSDPPSVKSGGGSRTGDAPREDLHRWLVNLPVHALSNPTPTR